MIAPPAGLAASASALAADAVTDIVEAIGRDHALETTGLTMTASPPPALVHEAWQLYDRHWQRFCGVGLDPPGCRFDNPARWSGRPSIRDGAPVVVVGTGPSLRPALASLKAVRGQVHLFTSPRGADALADAGITPDLVLVEHQTALDAQFTAQAMSERPQPWRQRVPLIAADRRTPAALVAGLADDRLFVVDRCPTWGLWPATAVALARRAGAAAIALVGIDLGSSSRPDPRQAPLRDLLSLLAKHSAAAHFDASIGAAKTGWQRGGVSSLASGTARQPLELIRRRWSSIDDRLAVAAASWHRLAPLAAASAAALAAAIRRRDGEPLAQAAVDDGLACLLAGGRITGVRIDVQDELGCAFLPRYWRTPPRADLGPRAWRPLALAAHELVQQHRALGRTLQARGVTR
jgi:hypothetical protein